MSQSYEYSDGSKKQDKILMPGNTDGDMEKLVVNYNGKYACLQRVKLI